MRVAQLLGQNGIPATILSDEIHEPYNRVRLTPLLSGDVQFGEITLTAKNSATMNIHTGVRVVDIDPDRKRVETANGVFWSFDKLVIATGSHAFVPNIPGAELSGVYTFRTADDASALLARSFSARNATIIGGGLLGLEAAKGLQQRGCHVTVVEHENRLMPRQLDRDGAQLLKTKIMAIGVEVLTGSRVSEIRGTDRVETVLLTDGTEIQSDTIVICAGVRANTELARSAGLPFGRGILVNAQMQTNVPEIYAVGECAQFEDEVVGLVGPGYAQADIAVASIRGAPEPYVATINATKLKVIGADVFSIGDVEQLEVRANVKSHIWSDETSYRRIFVDRGKLVGAIAVGSWDQTSRLQEAVHKHERVYPWMNYRFRHSGDIWPDAVQDAANLPDAATICNCTGVTCGQIRRALAGAANPTPELVGSETGASTVCGTCAPLIEEMIDAGAAPKAVAFFKPLLAISSVVTLLALIPLLIGYVPLPQSYDAESLRVWAWRDNIVKQWSGFTLLGIVLAALGIGLRKRMRFLDRLGSYDGWRLVHIFIGLAAMLGFFAHTGFRLGANWNFALGLCFVATLILGAFAGLATGGDHSLRTHGLSTAQKPARRVPTWLHIIAIWPLPLLLLFHVLTVYAF